MNGLRPPSHHTFEGAPPPIDRSSPTLDGSPPTLGNLHSRYEGLTPQQMQAVQHNQGPMLVLAGPGSGKTKTLVTRLAYLLDSGKALPEELLVVTFTRKAAEEVRSRLSRLVGTSLDRVTTGTFHAIAYQIQPPSGTLLSEADKQDLLTLAAKETKISLATLEQALVHIQETPEKRAVLSPGIQAGIDTYQLLCKRFRLYGMDDLLLTAHDALSQGFVKTPYRYISVDEYQDVNKVQRDLIKLLSGPDQNVFAIGDPNQSIYSFRGAQVKHIKAFQEDFPKAQVVELLHNFRSTKTIVDAAWSVITKNPQIQNPPMAKTKDGERIQLFSATTEKQEAILIAQEIERLVGGTSLSSYDTGLVSTWTEKSYAFSEIAVLCRTASRADALSDALAHAGIPVQRARTRTRHEQELHLLNAYMGLCENDGNLPLPKLLKILSHEDPAKGKEYQASLFATLHFPQISKLSTSQPKFGSSSQTEGDPPLINLKEWLRLSCPSLASHIEMLQTNWQADSFDHRLQKIGAYLGYAEELIPLLVEEYKVRGDVVKTLGISHESEFVHSNAERVSLLTMHGAKGLEFEVVFVAGCETNLLPGTSVTPEEIEEERRLFYVAMTRAKEQLYVSWVTQLNDREGGPSPFLKELPDSCIHRKEPPKKRKPQLNLF